MEVLFILVGLAGLVLFVAPAKRGNFSPPVEEKRVRQSKRAATGAGRRQHPHVPRTVAAIPRHPPPPPLPASRQLKGKAWAIDGDTIFVDKVNVRLAGIDAPELDQPWGQKSKWEMVRFCKGQVIRVELTGETSYERLVGTRYLPDGRDNGAEIIRAGKALDGSKWENWPVVLIVCVALIGGGNF